MLMLLKAVLHRQPVPVLRKAINWENLQKQCDFHNVLSIVYLGILGMEKGGFKAAEEQFYQKYRKALLLNNAFENAEQVLKWQLERHHIHALLLAGAECRELYPQPEMAYPGAIRILLADKDMGAVHQFMTEMDYERQENRIDTGIIYTRTPLLKVIFYTQFPVENKLYQKYFSEPIKKYQVQSGYCYIHSLEPEDEYLYMIGRIVELYVRKLLKIRDILDYWSFCRSVNQDFEWELVRDFLQKARFAEFTRQIDSLAQMWFGAEDIPYDDMTERLEEYILSDGDGYRALGEQLLPRETMRLNFYQRDREKEWSLKKKTWFFPPRDYMVQFFPILEKFPFLLVFCWVIRHIRLLRRFLMKEWKKIQNLFIKLLHSLQKKTEDEEDEHA